MSDSKQHSELNAAFRAWAMAGNASPYAAWEIRRAEARSLFEQLEALRTLVAQQLTPLDVAATHIDIIRRKGDEYSAAERDNVAAIVESHVKEARAALFASLSNPAKERP